MTALERKKYLEQTPDARRHPFTFEKSFAGKGLRLRNGAVSEDDIEKAAAVGDGKSFDGESRKDHTSADKKEVIKPSDVDLSTGSHYHHCLANHAIVKPSPTITSTLRVSIPKQSPEGAADSHTAPRHFNLYREARCTEKPHKRIVASESCPAL